MSIEDTEKVLKNQWQAVTQAPFFYIASVIIVLLACYLFLNNLYQTRLESKQSVIEAKNSTIERLNGELLSAKSALSEIQNGSFNGDVPDLESAIKDTRSPTDIANSLLAFQKKIAGLSNHFGSGPEYEKQVILHQVERAKFIRSLNGKQFTWKVLPKYHSYYIAVDNADYFVIHDTSIPYIYDDTEATSGVRFFFALEESTQIINKAQDAELLVIRGVMSSGFKLLNCEIVEG